jgi:hypothetical protein
MGNVIYRQLKERAPGVTIGLDIVLAGADTDIVDPSTATIVEIPPEVDFGIGTLVYKYAKLRPTNAETPNLTMRFDLGALSQSAEMQTLRSGLLNPFAYTWQMDLGLEGGSFAMVNWKTSNLWKVYAIIETSSGTVTITLFKGVQRRLPKRQGTISDIFTGRATATLEIPLVHVARATLETIQMDWLSRTVINRSSGRKGPFECEYEALYKEGTWTYAKGNSNRDKDPYTKLLYWPWRDLWTWLQSMAATVYRSFTRQTSGGFGFVTELSGVSGTPLDHIVFLRQGHRADASITGTALTPSDLYIRGAMYPSNVAGDTDRTVWTGGLFHDDGRKDSSNSLYRFRNSWDFVTTCSAWFRSKMQFDLEDGDHCKVGFGRLFRNLWPETGATGADPHVIDGATADERAQLFGGRKLEYEEGAGLITGVRVAVPGMDGDDINEVPSTLVGIEAEEEEQIRALFHTSYTVGQSKETFARYATGVTTVAPFDDIPRATYGDSYGGCVRHFNPWLLFYIERPSLSGSFLASGEVPLLPNQQVAVNEGSTSFLWGDVGSFPYFTSGITPSSAFESWYSQVRALLLSFQRGATLVYAVAESTMFRWGYESTAQATYNKIAFPLELTRPRYLGEFFRIGPDGSATLNLFLPDGETYLSHLKTDYALLVDLSIDIKTALCTCTFIRPKTS